MGKRARVALITAGAATITTLLCAVACVITNCRDIASPNTSDLVPDTIDVPDANNAYTYFTNAFALSALPKNDFRADLVLAGEKWDERFVADLVSRNAEALAQVERGLACSIYWVHAASESDLRKMPGQWRELSKVMTLKALHERQTGQTERALEACLDLLCFGSLVTVHPAGISDWTAGVDILESGLKEAARLLNELTLSEAQLAGLSDRLNQMGTFGRGWTRIIKAEFQSVNEEIRRRASLRSAVQWLDSYWFHPNRTRSTFASFCRTMMENASRPYAEMYLPRTAPERHLPLLRANGVAESILPAPDYLNRSLAGKCEIQSHLDGLRLVVACQIYEIRHGQLPETVDVLVPELLSAVPRDPFDGKPFRYSREDAVVYSVGRDLKDSRALGVHGPDVLISNRRSGKTDDLVYYIHAKAE